MAAPVFGLIGISHRTAEVAVRERMALDGEAQVRLQEALRAAGIAESVVLSTCNRTEIYGVGRPGMDAEGTEAALVEALCQDRGVPVETLRDHLYRMRGVDAVRHLFRVAAALDSLVLGEPQILGQVKDAYRAAVEQGRVGPLLARFFEKAFKVAKEVRTDTEVGSGQVSVGSIAVDLARQVFGNLGQSTVLLLGAGEMAEAVARALAAAGARQVVVANRTLERAMVVAERHGWGGRPLEALPELLAEADVVIASLGAPRWVVDRAGMREALRRRRNRPVFLVDIAVPRVVDPSIARMEGAYLYNLDDFQEVVQEHLRRREADLSKAEAIIAREVEGMQRYLRVLEVQPVLAALGQRAADIRDREVARAIRELPEVSPEVRKVLEGLGQSLASKLLHDPLCVLRESAWNGEGGDVAEAARRLFRLPEDGAEKGPEGRPQAVGEEKECAR
ncbi:glutamyl-tRNA reductase [Myxococcota bacterium]|nr:glutamyl-tRNA reductase [Myxococcota bacterium]